MLHAIQGVLREFYQPHTQSQWHLLLLRLPDLSRYKALVV